MHGFSTVDGFMNVKEDVDAMIKYIANEPSVGLFFVQQHAQSSMPYLLTLKGKVAGTIHEVTLHTEDTEDSICVVRSMTEYGLPIVDEMIEGIKKSLLIMSSSQPKRGLITPTFFNYDVGGQRDKSGRGYLSAVFNSAKQKAAGLRWHQPDSVAEGFKNEQLVPSTTTLPLAINASAPSTPTAAEAEELPLSSTLVDEGDEPAPAVDERSDDHDLSMLLEDYDKFRTEREAKLEEWLQEEKHNQCSEAGG